MHVVDIARYRQINSRWSSQRLVRTVKWWSTKEVRTAYQKCVFIKLKCRVIHTLPRERSSRIMIMTCAILRLGRILAIENYWWPTFYKVWDETWLIRIDQATLTSNGDCCQYIVPSTHNIPYPCLVQLRDHIGSLWFQFILKDNETNKFQVTFCISTRHLLGFHPAKFLFVFGGAGNDTVAFVSIFTQEIFKVKRHCIYG